MLVCITVVLFGSVVYRMDLVLGVGVGRVWRYRCTLECVQKWKVHFGHVTRTDQCVVMHVVVVVFVVGVGVVFMCIDDFGVHLDDQRKQHFEDLLEGFGQVFITMPKNTLKLNPDKTYLVKSGVLNLM